MYIYNFDTDSAIDWVKIITYNSETVKWQILSHQGLQLCLICRRIVHPVKRAGDVTLKEVPTRELYVFSACVSWVLKKQQSQFMKEFRRGVYNGIQIRCHAKGWVYNFHDIIRFLFPYITEDKIADIMLERLDRYAEANPGFVKLYLE